MTYGIVAVFLSAAVGTVAGVAAWGFHRVVSLSGHGRPAPEKRCCSIAASNAVYLIPLSAVVSVGVLLSTITRNSAAAVVGDDRGRDRARHHLGDPGPRRVAALPAHPAVRGLAGPAAHAHRLGPDHALGVGVRAVRGARRCSPPTSCSCAATSPAADAARRGPAWLDLGGQLDQRQLDVAHQAAGLARVDQAGAQARGGLRAAGHAEAQALVGRAPFIARGQVARQEGVAGAALARSARAAPCGRA